MIKSHEQAKIDNQIQMHTTGFWKLSSNNPDEYVIYGLSELIDKYKTYILAKFTAKDYADRNNIYKTFEEWLLTEI
jgi:hypothetical protein